MQHAASNAHAIYDAHMHHRTRSQRWLARAISSSSMCQLADSPQHNLARYNTILLATTQSGSLQPLTPVCRRCPHAFVVSFKLETDRAILMKVRAAADRAPLGARKLPA
jgi:hypothetical protein